VPKGEWTDHEDRLAAEWLQKSPGKQCRLQLELDLTTPAGRAMAVLLAISAKF